MTGQTTQSKANEPVLFRGEYVFRSRNGIASVIVALAFGICFLLISISLLFRTDGLLAKVAGAFFASGAVFFGFLGMVGLVNLILDRRTSVFVSEEGIGHGRKFIPWSEISNFRGTRHSNGICLGYMNLRGTTRGDGSLPTTPLLSENEYVELATELKRRIASVFPHVDVSIVAIDGQV